MHLGTIHGPGRRPLEVDSFTVVATAVTGTLKLVFARPPVWSAAKMRAAGVDNEYPVRSLVDPDAILLLPLGIDAKRIVGWKTNPKYAGWLENRPGQKEPQKHQEAGRQKDCYAGPNNAPAHLVDWRIGRAFDECRGRFWRRRRRTRRFRRTTWNRRRVTVLRVGVCGRIGGWRLIGLVIQTIQVPTSVYRNLSVARR